MNHLSPKTNIETVKRLYELFNERQWQEMASLYSEKTHFLNPRQEGVITRDNEDIPLVYAALERKYPGVKEKILYIEECGDLVYVQFLTSGKSKSGGQWQQIVWTIFTVLNRKIAKVATYFNYPD